MQGGLRVITLQEAKEKSPILLLQYWKNEWLDGTIIISYFGGRNNIFADCNYLSIRNQNIFLIFQSDDKIKTEFPKLETYYFPDPASYTLRNS